MKTHELLSKAAEIHNSKPYNERLVLCISSAQTQITTLEQIKQDIINNAEKQCKNIDSWIQNIAKQLEENLKEFESQKGVSCETKND